MGDEDPYPWMKMGDGDPFPVAVTSGGKAAGKWVKGKATYRAFQIGPFVEVVATGTLNNFNMEAKLVPSMLTIHPPEYGLMFFVPEIGLPAQKPFVATATFHSKNVVNKVVVWDVDGKQEVAVTQSPK